MTKPSSAARSASCLFWAIAFKFPMPLACLTCIRVQGLPTGLPSLEGFPPLEEMPSVSWFTDMSETIIRSNLGASRFDGCRLLQTLRVVSLKDNRDGENSCSTVGLPQAYGLQHGRVQRSTIQSASICDYRSSLASCPRREQYETKKALSSQKRALTFVETMTDIIQESRPNGRVSCCHQQRPP